MCMRELCVDGFDANNRKTKLNDNFSRASQFGVLFAMGLGPRPHTQTDEPNETNTNITTIF